MTGSTKQGFTCHQGATGRRHRAPYGGRRLRAGLRAATPRSASTTTAAPAAPSRALTVKGSKFTPNGEVLVTFLLVGDGPNPSQYFEEKVQADSDGKINFERRPVPCPTATGYGAGSWTWVAARDTHVRHQPLQAADPRRHPRLHRRLTLPAAPDAPRAWGPCRQDWSDRGAPTWDERYSAPTDALRDPNALSSRSSATPTRPALELAAGEGRHARWLASLGWDVVAVDFSEVALRRARQLAGDEGAARQLRRGRRPHPPAAAGAVRPGARHLLPPPSERAPRPVPEDGPCRSRPAARLLLVSYDKANLAEGNRRPAGPRLPHGPAGPGRRATSARARRHPGRRPVQRPERR